MLVAWHGKNCGDAELWMDRLSPFSQFYREKKRNRIFYAGPEISGRKVPERAMYREKGRVQNRSEVSEVSHIPEAPKNPGIPGGISGILSPTGLSMVYFSRVHPNRQKCQRAQR